MSATHPLDNPALSSLLGTHAHLAERYGQVVRYETDVSPWVAVPEPADEGVWKDVATLCGPGGVATFAGLASTPPTGWAVDFAIPGVQMTGESVQGKEDPDAIVLSAEDIPDMLDLVARTRPGPFLPRTIEMGTYLGIRHNGALVAMTGERLKPSGWTEISAVCTDDAFRGRGLATRLVLAVAAGIRARGETPFLHTGAANANAIRLYEALGFQVRRQITFMGVQVPALLDAGTH